MSFVSLECRAFLQYNVGKAVWDKPYVKKKETWISEQLVIWNTDKTLKDGWETKRCIQVIKYGFKL